VATRCTIWVVATIFGIGCARPAPPAIPGHTDVSVRSVEIEPRSGERSEVDYEPLLENLGLRAKTAIRPERTFNPFRLAEDRRRIAAYLQDRGYFEAEVDEPELAYADDHRSVAVTWHVHEGTPYTIADVQIVGAPADDAEMLRAMVPFHAGDRIDLETYRPLRRALAERLQDEGYGHARGYSRMFVDRDAKTVAWFYYIDPGPQTRIGSLHVEGNHKVPADVILERTGLAPGHRYSTAEKRRAELALLDSGAFASAIVLSDADIQTGPPEHPDTGGVLAPEQVDADGKLVPRQLSDELAVRVIVVEAPARQLRAEVGVEADPTRLDAYAGTRLLVRNLFAPQHHLALEGNVGYGFLVRDGDPAKGVYGSAQAQYLRPGFIHRALDLRVTTRWRDTLYPSALLREVVAGPGVRSTVAPGVFFDVDAYYRFGREIGLPALDAMSTQALALATNDSRGAELVASVMADRRNDRVEPTDGWLLGLRGSYSPGGPLADHRWLQLVGDARGFVPLTAAWSVGARASAGAVTLPGADGIPLGPRLFGGGAYGMRGFGRDHLSPAACADMMTTECKPVLVGGRSLVESSVELRYLPFRKLYGAAAFVDAGAAGAGVNPVESGVSAAVGVGGRIRTWYLPVAIDVSYRAVEDNRLGAAWNRLLVFFRVGEAF
jgi:outer membrane translocation and assembly module TamA